MSIKPRAKFKKPLLVFIFNILCFSLFTPYSQAQAALKNYISYDLEYRPFEEMRVNLEKNLGFKLKNRGEAHITVVTPPEYALLSQKLKPEQIHTLANETLLRKPSYQVICVGSGTVRINQSEEKTYFAVVEARELLKIRRDLAQASGLPVDLFNPELFFPHVTLGFTSRDLHYEDGVIKDKNSCLKK